MIQQSRISVRCSNVSYPISKRTPDSQLLDVGSLINAFRLNINPWFCQGWVKKPWHIKTSVLR